MSNNRATQKKFRINVKKLSKEDADTLIKDLKNKMKKRIRVHNHPHLERTLQVPEGHVIIDEDLYMEILQKYGNYIITDEREKSNERG